MRWWFDGVVPVAVERVGVEVDGGGELRVGRLVGDQWLAAPGW